MKINKNIVNHDILTELVYQEQHQNIVYKYMLLYAVTGVAEN
uniref:Uncharacterized protein n=1 Tax=Klebsiella pneumoniae TaxID=573 RepID=A0A3T0VEN1_KLEPN|nr:hypothetical protein [Klebsiella pneumoniae]QIZ17643.1 hypothetical protein [Klebsiella pneumoniae]